MKKIILISGPTGSGKSHLALKLACKYDALIINADAHQVYKGLESITASPSAEEKNMAQHALYNYLAVSEDYTVARYLADFKHRISSTKHQYCIIVGGSGMYINSLLYGFHQLPKISLDIREEAQRLFQEIGKDRFYQKLEDIFSEKQHSNLSQEYLYPSLGKCIPKDPYRMMRNYEIWLSTGMLAYEMFASLPIIKPLEEYNNIEVYMLNPTKDFLRERCKTRIEDMLLAGIIDEVATLLNRPYVSLSAAKIIGVRELKDYIEGKISKQAALDLMLSNTLKYAKRQITWFKNKLQNKTILDFCSIDELNKLLLNPS